jgi:RNA polymerase sigma-70 factor, ECF subfamily
MAIHAQAVSPDPPRFGGGSGRGSGDNVYAGVEDGDVLALIDEGDLEMALQRLMQRHGVAMYRYCCTALDCESLADDVLQQVFIEAFRDLRSFSGRSTLRAWLFGITRHRVLDQKRVTKRSMQRQRQLKGDGAADPRPLAAEQIDDEQLRQALLGCVSELGEHVRNALLLRFQQGFSFEEMAEISNEKAGTLQARVARALPVLRECIEERTGGSV